MISELLAILAAVCSAASGMLVGELAGRVDVFRFARWTMLAAVLLCGSASLLNGAWRSLEPWQIGLLAASSAAGIMLASSTYIAAIYAAGPRLAALLFALASPFALGLGYVVLDETVSPLQGLGVAIVFAGVVLAVRSARRRDGSPATPTPARLPWRGLAFGVITALGQAGGILLARPAMAAGVEPFTAMAVRSGLGAVFFFALLPVRALRRPYSFTRRDVGIGIGSALLGTGLGMVLLMAALAHGKVGIVTTLSSMTPVMILPMVWIRHRAAPTTWAWIGAALAVIGTGLISSG